MARKLGQDAFGEFIFALSLASVFLVVAGLGTDPFLTRAIGRTREAVHDLFWNAIAIKLSFGILAVFLANLVVDVGGYGSTTRGVVAILSVAALIELLSETVRSTFRGYERMGPVALALVLQRLVTAAVGIAAMLGGADVIAVSLVYLFGAVIALAYLAVRLARVGIPRAFITFDKAKRLLIDSIPIGVATLFGAALARADAILVSLLKGNSAVGIYGAGYRLFDSTLFLTWAFGLSSLPAFSKLTRETEPSITHAFAMASKVTTAVLFPIGMIFVLFAGPLVSTLYGSGFDDAASVVRLLGPATALFGPATVSMYVNLSQDRQRLVAWIIAGVAVENVVLNLFAIPRWSADGAAAVMSISEITLFAATFITARRAVGHVSLTRLIAGPGMGCVFMAAAGYALGSNYAGLGVAMASYSVAVYGVERRFYPTDLRFMRSSLSSRLAPGGG